MKFKAVMLSLGLSLFFTTPYYANDINSSITLVASNTVNTINSQFSGGDGTYKSPYIIENEQQLKLLNNYLGEKYKSTYFELKNDITLSSPWTPIGMVEGYDANNVNQWFGGHLEGKWHTINALNINLKVDSSANVGLFTAVYGEISNLIINGDIFVEGDLSENESIKVGALAGISQSVGHGIERITSNVNVTIKSLNGKNSVYAGGVVGTLRGNGMRKGTISSYSTGNIEAILSKDSSLNSYVGGIVGSSDNSKFVNCSSTGNIHAQGGYYSFAGGIAGLATSNSSVEHTYSSSDVLAESALMQNNAGGIVGQVSYDSLLASSFSTGDVTTSGNPDYFNSSGGLAGSVYENSNVKNCYTLSNVSSIGGRSSIGTLIGRLSTSSIYHSYTVGTLNSSMTTPLQDYLTIIGSINDGKVNIVNCAFLNDKNNKFTFFDDSSVKNETFTDVNIKDVTNSKIYENKDWDFNNVWSMPNSESTYRFPILTIYFQTVQNAL